MSTLRFALKSVMFAGALLAAQTTLASDVTTERQQTPPQQTSQATDRKVPAQPLGRASPEVSAAKSCACSHSTPSSKSLSPAEEEELNQLRWQNG